jgi:glutamate decarboxylase
VIHVKCDKEGRMIASDLDLKMQESINKGEVPVMVNATIGTTVYGAVDHLESIAAVCEKHDTWLHADACLGGTLILSNDNKNLIMGINRVDSIAWDPHKHLMVPLQCSMYMHKHENLMSECNSMNASYLFHKDRKGYDLKLDTGDKSIQCGRHIDVVKLWTYFQGNGMTKIRTDIDHMIHLSKFMAEELKRRPDMFELILEPEFSNVCFFYIPESMRNVERN